MIISCAHKKETLTSPVVYTGLSGTPIVQQLDDKYFENIIFMFSVELEYQGFYHKALEGYHFLLQRYPKDAFLHKKIKFIECSLDLKLC
jgi:hypothetical protein